MKLFKSIPCIAGGHTGFDNQFLHNGWKITNTHIVQKNPNSKLEIVDCNAVVPGNLRMSLIQSKIISDPFIGKNNEESKWVSEQEWQYSNVLNLNSLKDKILRSTQQGGLIHIIFDAIDYDTTFRIDGNKITRQIGMFSPTDIVAGISSQEKSDITNIPITLDFHVQPFW